MTYHIPQIKLVYVSDDTHTKTKIRHSSETAEMFRQTFEPGEIEMQEYFKVMYLDKSMNVIGIHTISMGGIDRTIVDPKIIFGGALTAKASAIIACHNHPSGTARPSIEDDNITRKLRDGGNLLEIGILDHIIITSNDFYSYADTLRLKSI